jgi:hypothetical protein
LQLAEENIVRKSETMVQFAAPVEKKMLGLLATFYLGCIWYKFTFVPNGTYLVLYDMDFV